MRVDSKPLGALQFLAIAFLPMFYRNLKNINSQPVSLVEDYWRSGIVNTNALEDSSSSSRWCNLCGS